ncbi:probable calcium-binding protein CML25 [Carica papaya]|uniref:Calmodulin-like protein 25 n=1 Tax=Carica papaya TaxID=3649 RepID=A0A3Q8UB68_CARPA|nr:probable calcium-binding protein CML25 [Carica papaya]AZL94057.1 calmodulin-like protein 25 [Carica papaya]
MGFGTLFNRKKSSNQSSTSAPASPPLATTSFVPGSPFLTKNHSGKTEIRELEQVFKKFDANGDGKISAAELGAIMASLGHVATEEELQKVVTEVDADGDGFIDFNEFVELNTKGMDSDEVLENLKDAFSVYDIDGNGSITAEELHEVLRSLGDECSLADCRKMISGVDKDGDGTIDFEEFKVMMMMGSRYDAMGSHSQRSVSIKID